MCNVIWHNFTKIFCGCLVSSSAKFFAHRIAVATRRLSGICWSGTVHKHSALLAPQDRLHILPFDAFFAGNYAVAAHYPALNSNHRQCTGSAGSALYLHLDPSATADVSYPHCSTQWRQSSYISQPWWWWWWWWLWWQSIEIDIKYIKISGMGWDVCTGGDASVPWSSKHLSQSFLYSGWR